MQIISLPIKHQMNSTTTVTESNLPGVSHIGSDNSLVTVRVPTNTFISANGSPNSFFGDVLLLGTGEDNVSPTGEVEFFNGEIPETIFIEGEPVNANESPVLVKDPNLFSVSQESQTKKCKCPNRISCICPSKSGPPPRKRRKMLQQINVNVTVSPSSSADSPPSPTHVNWPCAFCERYFVAKVSLYRHYRTVHPNRHCAQCVNPKINDEIKPKTRRKKDEKPKKTKKEVEEELKVKFKLKECRVSLPLLSKKEILEKTKPPPLPRENNFPRMYSKRRKATENFVVENEESLVGKDVLIGNDILTEEIVISVSEPKINKDSSPRKRSNEMFECEVCGDVFTLKIGLINHTRFKHSEKLVPQLKCDKCDEQFGQLTNYQRHIERCKEGVKEMVSATNAYHGRNLFEELTNFRPMHVERKSEDVLPLDSSQENSILANEEEIDDDEIIKNAEHQLLTSPTSSPKLKDEIRKKVPVKRQNGVLDDIMREPDIKRRKCDKVTELRRQNDISLSPTVVMNRVVDVDPLAVPENVSVVETRIQSVAESPEPEVIVKRKRGRPRKNNLDTPSPPKKITKQKKKKKKRGRPKKIPEVQCQKVDANNDIELKSEDQTTIKLFYDDDSSFSPPVSENGENGDPESEFVNVEDEDDETFNLTLSDDDDLNIDVLNMSEGKLDLNLFDFNGNPELDRGIKVEAEVNVVEKKTSKISNCISLVI